MRRDSEWENFPEDCRRIASLCDVSQGVSYCTRPEPNERAAMVMMMMVMGMRMTVVLMMKVMMILLGDAS